MGEGGVGEMEHGIVDPESLDCRRHLSSIRAQFVQIIVQTFSLKKLVSRDVEGTILHRTFV